MTPSARKTKGKRLEDRISDKIHDKLMSDVPSYKALYEQFNDPKLRPRRDASSGASNDSDGDINLGIASKVFPFSVECKDWASLDLNLNQLISGKIKSLERIMEEQVAIKIATKNLKPIIVFKALRTIDFVCYKSDYMPFQIEGNYCKVNDFIIASFDEFLDISTRNLK